MSKQRPLSPFMLGQTYRFQITSVMSILHRISGVALYAGAFILVWWLSQLAAGPLHAQRAVEILASLPGKLVLFGFSLCLVYHLLNGIRHLAWDAGHGFQIPSVYRSGYTVAALTLVFTALIWAFALRGAA